MSTIPEGWTDDMSIALPEGVTIERLVTFVLETAKSGRDYGDCIDALIHWGIEPGDAEFACDRVMGGVVRAATKNPENAPRPEKDPMAAASYERCRREPNIIGRLFPEYAAPVPAAKRS